MALVFDTACYEIIAFRDPELLFGPDGPSINDEDIVAYNKTLCRCSGKAMF